MPVTLVYITVKIDCSDDFIPAHTANAHAITWTDTVRPMMAARRYGVRHKGLFPELPS